MNYYCIRKEEWAEILEQMKLHSTIFTIVSNEFGQDYELLKPSGIYHISYNGAKPATPLKRLFTPVTEKLYHFTSPDKYHLVY